jgi:hypothetical protein
MIILLYIVAGAFLDRLRGGGFVKQFSSVPAMLAYSLLLSTAVVDDPIQILILTGAFALGESFGWGYPMSSALRGYSDARKDGGQFPKKGPLWWQFGFLKYRNYEALFLRGVLWGIPPMVAALFWGAFLWWIPLIMGVTMLLSIIIAAEITKKDANKGWALAEMIRGGSTAGILIGVS